MRIGVYDSGLGGLTVLKSLMEIHSNNEYIYLGDTLNLPYGDKTKEELMNISNKCINFLINKNVELIIIACGTLSSNIYDEIKDNYNIKILDIITPIASYLKEKCFRNVLLLGTQRTIDSGVFKEKLKRTNLIIYDASCPKFVPILEGLLDDNIDIVINDYLSAFKNKKIDLIIPGCTHYPLLKEKLENYLNTDMLDIGKLIANNLIVHTSLYSLDMYFTKLSKELSNNIYDILDFEFEINLVNL